MGPRWLVIYPILSYPIPTFSDSVIQGEFQAGDISKQSSLHERHET